MSTDISNIIEYDGLAERLAEVRKRDLGMDQGEMGKLLKMSRTTVAYWETGRTIPSKEKLDSALKKINKIGGDAEYVRTGRRSGGGDLVEDRAGSIHVPVYDVRASMGNGRFNDDYPTIVREILISHEWVQRYLPPDHSKQLVVFCGDGNCMEPFYKDGDLIIADTGFERDYQTMKSGVYLFRLEGALYAKELRRIPGGFRALEAEGIEAFSIDLKSVADFEIIARVLRAWVMH